MYKETIITYLCGQNGIPQLQYQLAVRVAPEDHCYTLGRAIAPRAGVNCTAYLHH